MPLKEMAASTSAWLLTRSLGGTLGIAIFQAVITTGLESRFPRLEGYGTQFGIPHDLEGYHQLHNLPEGPTRDAALFAFSDSLRVSAGYRAIIQSPILISTLDPVQLLWIIWTPMMGVALAVSHHLIGADLDQELMICVQLSFWTRTYSLDRLPGQQTATSIETKVDDDLEKGPLDSSESDTVAIDRAQNESKPEEVEEEIQKQGTILDPVAPAGQPFAEDVVQGRTNAKNPSG